MRDTMTRWTTVRPQGSTRGKLAASLILVAMFCGAITMIAQRASGDGVPGGSGGTSSDPYPPAFVAYMDVNYGRYWMHTVQEKVVFRIYTAWLVKEAKR